MTAAVILPATGRLIEPYILVWLGALLFLNLLRLNSSDLAAIFKKPRQILLLADHVKVLLPQQITPDCKISSLCTSQVILIDFDVLERAISDSS
jgi:predicted Na+-dependent transporter